jgi:hypothetical protein
MPKLAGRGIDEHDGSVRCEKKYWAHYSSLRADYVKIDVERTPKACP